MAANLCLWKACQMDTDLPYGITPQGKSASVDKVILAGFRQCFAAASDIICHKTCAGDCACKS